MTWIILFFWKKSFSATSWMQFWLALRKAFSRKGENLFPQGPNLKQFFWRKNVKFSSGQLECNFEIPPQNVRPMWKFYIPAQRFSTTAEKILPNVGRWKENYNFFRSNNDPRNVTLDMLHFVSLDNFVKIFHNWDTWALRMKNLQHCLESFDEVGFFLA